MRNKGNTHTHTHTYTHINICFYIPTRWRLQQLVLQKVQRDLRGAVVQHFQWLAGSSFPLALLNQFKQKQSIRRGINNQTTSFKIFQEAENSCCEYVVSGGRNFAAPVLSTECLHRRSTRDHTRPQMCATVPQDVVLEVNELRSQSRAHAGNWLLKDGMKKENFFT